MQKGITRCRQYFQVKELEQCRVATKKDCSEFSRVLLDLNPEHTYNFLLAVSYLIHIMIVMLFLQKSYIVFFQNKTGFERGWMRKQVHLSLDFTVV